ncbi:transketolase [Pseudomonas sp. XS1P51]
MQATSQSAVWIKEPSADAGVVIVTSAALPKYMIDKLHVAIDDWDQVAYLVVTQSRALMLDWLRVGSNPEQSSLVDGCDASQLLCSVSKGSFLLDVEVGAVPGLTWLGSVCGHPLRVVELGTVASSSAAMDRQVEEVLSVTRRLAKSVLQERGVI